MVEYIRKGSVAVLLVDEPPVNALSHKVRQGIRDGILRAASDGKVRSIVIGGRNKFLAGADIKEFASGGFTEDPTLTSLCDTIEECLKPVVCAIEKFALGGGFEVAISSHYRVAQADTVFGFPEIDLGILPAATGTQRFPRLVGLQAALELIPSGQRFDAKTALNIGAVDKVVEKDVLNEAVKFASGVSSQSLEGRRTSRRPVKDAANAAFLHRKAVERATKKYPGLIAPIFAIKAVMASVTESSFEEGKVKEKENALLLFGSGQALALQYAFFAQRKAIQWSLLDGTASYKNTKPLPVNSVAVVGVGTMGTGIAMAVLNSGLQLILLEQNEKMLDKGLQMLKSLFEGSVRLGHMSSAVAMKRLGQCKTTLNYNDLKNVDLVIEAVFEKMNVKKEVFAKLDKVCKKEAILCSNTSSLSIDKIASATSRPNKVIGMHFFVPAYYMKLIENIRGKLTSPETMATATRFGQQIGKVPVLVGNCHGFVGNRIFRLMNMEAMFMIEEGCLPHEIDQVAEDFGLPLGPFKVMDLSGLDIGKYIIEETAKSLGVSVDINTRLLNGSRFSPLTFLLVNKGRLGRKAGAGWYNYEHPGSKIPYVSEYVSDLIINFRKQHSIEPRHITPQEILERLLYPVINEGFRILEEGIARTPEEIDTIALLGFGWPRQTGGPMYYARMTGLPRVYQSICHYNQCHPTSTHWLPSAALHKEVKEYQPTSNWRSQL